LRDENKEEEEEPFKVDYIANIRIGMNCCFSFSVEGEKKRTYPALKTGNS
jgi:hypothetical protein